jgi:hypothetical protein
MGDQWTSLLARTNARERYKKGKIKEKRGEKEDRKKR